MFALQPLRADHADAVLAFERDNRAYFATLIADRGDAFFEQFAERHRAALDEQDAGSSALFLLVDDGEVLGRFNLYDRRDGCATVGYRVAQRVAGRGIATAAVRELCDIAPGLGLHTLTAATSHSNVASQRVLLRAGFEPTGAADPAELGGKQGVHYRLELGVDGPDRRAGVRGRGPGAAE